MSKKTQKQNPAITFIGNNKPRIFILHGTWHCSSAAIGVYGFGASPAAAYWAAMLVRKG